MSGADVVDVVVVGAGLFGLTIAERVAGDLGLKVLVLDCRSHLGGNCWSESDPATGIEVHRYGSHIFHCSDETIWRYINRFSAFNDYRHQVWTVHDGRAYAMPINLATLCAFYRRVLSPDQARALVTEAAAELGGRTPQNLEEKAIASVGRPLYEALIRGYTQKQWGADPRTLPSEIITRLPVRTSFDSRYFSDRFQGVPVDGYAALLTRMATSPDIELRLGCDFFEVRDRLPTHRLLVYTGPIDRYFNDRCGRLGWRAVRFERETVATGDFQGTAVVNYADPEVPWTRIHEFRHYHPERPYPIDRTVISREFSCTPGPDADPAYPIRTPDNRRLLEAYRALALAEPATVFGGRLGSYRYLDMHQVLGSALKTFDTVIRPRLLGQGVTAAALLTGFEERP
jgi:UDP-galactopyranose mutase